MNNVDWTTVGFIGAAFIAGSILGVYVFAPMVHKDKFKKDTEQKTQSK